MASASLAKINRASGLRAKMNAWAETHVAEVNRRRAKRQSIKESNQERHHAGQLLSALLRAVVISKNTPLLELLDAALPVVQSVSESEVSVWMDTPEKRRLIWGWQAVAATLAGDECKARECATRARAEDDRCSIRLLRDRTLLPTPG